MHTFYFCIFLYTIINFEAQTQSIKQWNREKAYDFIIVGSGTSGTCVASRLSEVKNYNVLLLEAGGEPQFFNRIPYFSPGPFGGDLDWNFETESQKHACLALKNETCPCPRGKGLGGTTLINGMVFDRGDANDYDNWEKLGNEGWSYENVLPYFKKLETYKGFINSENKNYHGFDGPMFATRPPYETKLAKVILEAGKELGYSQVDYNSKSRTGFANNVFTIKNGTRWSVYDGYLRKARKRKNLEIVTNAFVEKVEFNDNIAIGVIFLHNGEMYSVKAKKEIILSAGALNTPKILMLSGIGPKETLTKYQIPIVKDLPGVGQNLQDHVMVFNTIIALNEEIGFKESNDVSSSSFEQWEMKREGPLTVPLRCESIAFLSSEYVDKSKNWPDLELIFPQTPLKFNTKEEYKFETIAPEGKNYVFALLLLLRPKSIGYTAIQSRDLRDSPKIQPNYLSDRDDVLTLVSGLKKFQSLVNTEAFQKYGAFWNHKTPTKGCEQYKFLSDEYLECDIGYHTIGSFHACCTAKMGLETDSMAVVDNELRVNGVKNLRVADLSIPPNIPSSATMISTIMIGEKAADMIKNYWNEKHEEL